MTQTAPRDSVPDQGPVALLRRSDVRLFFLAITLSFTGSNVVVLAGGVWAKELTGSNGAGALVAFFVAVPALLYPLFGVLVDRTSRRAIMVVANILMAGAASLLFLVSGASDLWLIYLVTFVFGSALAVMTVAESGLFATMLPPAQLGSANSLLQSIQESMKVLAPALGIGVFAAFGGGAVTAIAAVTTLLAGTALWFLPATADPQRPGGATGGILDGLRHIARTPTLRAVIVASVAALLTMGFTQTAVFGVVDRLHRPAAFVGVLVTAQGIGSVLSSLAAPSILGRLGERRFAALAIGLTSAGTALLLAPELAAVLPGMALQGAGMPWLIIAALTLTQRSTPAALQGRTAAMTSMLIFGPLAASRLAGAALDEPLGDRGLLAITSVATAVTAVLLVLSAPQVNREEIR